MLQGHTVQLEPLEITHVPDLCAIGLDSDLWRWTLEQVRTPQEMKDYVVRATADPKTRAYAVRSLEGGRIAGCTRYMNMEPGHGRLEIGSTWYGLEFQRTAVNTECKYLLLQHAFETLNMNRVELKTDALNERSRRAIVRIGAQEEGTLRHHMITAEGRVRDTVYYSVIRDEWPLVRAGLLEKLRS